MRFLSEFSKVGFVENYGLNLNLKNRTFQLVTLETTLRMYWRDPRLQVEHLLGNSSRDYILLHPDTSKFIWFPDIYIGKSHIRYFLFLIIHF